MLAGDRDPGPRLDSWGRCACGLLARVVIRLLGLAVIRLIDWVWWGPSGRTGLAGVAWHFKEAARRPSLPLACFGSLRRETAHAPRLVVITLFVGCVLLCMAVGVLDFLDVVDPD